MSFPKDSLTQYEALPLKQDLFKQSTSKPDKLSYLPIASKLSIVIFRKRLYIKSEPDRYQYIRMFVFGLLMKAYTDQTQREIIDIIKRVIEGSVDLPMTNSKYNKLKKKMDDVPMDKGVETENAVIGLFVQASDSLIIDSFVEFIQQEGSDSFRMNECKNWFESKFGEKIKVLDNHQDANQSIIFVKDGDKILYQSQKDVQAIEGMSLGSNMLTRSQLMVVKTDSKPENDIMELSIMKPSLHMVSDSIPSPGIHHKRLGNQAQSIEIKQFDQQDLEKKEIKQKQKGFDIWDYLCC